jgi:class 3 adenylate cyclase
MTPETSYARRGDFHLAYQVLGSGPPDVLLFDQWFSHMEAQWDVAPLARFRERLAAFSRLILFDKRGSGLSDPVPTAELPSLAVWMEDASIVLDAAGSERAALITNLAGGLLAISYAVAHPERVSALVLVDAFARALAAPDYPIGASPEALTSALDSVENSGGRGFMLDAFAPSVAGDERLRRSFARYERLSASPGSMIATVRLMWQSDVRDLLPKIGVPTLVIQRAEAEGFGVEYGRYLGGHIPNARYVELPGIDSLIWAGDQDAILGEIEWFLTGARTAAEPTRVLATVLFTDIVGSTHLAAEMGDERWRALLDDHHRLARQVIERFGGRLVKTTGDGVLATFDRPARAIRGAAALRDGLREIGIPIRAGLHTGEIEIQGEDIAGLAVHIGARVSALAEDGELLVSSTVKDLVTGSGIEFTDRGSHVLKGVPEEWRLFAATS